MLANETPPSPGSVSNKIHAPARLGDSEFGEFQPEVFGDESLDLLLGAVALSAGQPEQNEVVDVPAIPTDAEFALHEVIEWVEVDQRVDLAEEVADRDADRLAVIREQHHEVDKPTVLDFSLDLLAQDAAIDPVKEFANIKFQRVAIPAGLL